MITFSDRVLKIDPALETDRIVAMLQDSVRRVLRRYGGVVGISGGVDSSVVLALCVRAFGAQNVAAIMMPENDSDPQSLELGQKVAQQYGVVPTLEVITPVLEGFGCYRRRDEAVRRLFPEYDAAAGYKLKIGLPQDLLEDNTLNYFLITIVTPEGEEKAQRLPVREFFEIVAASNFKQRTRMAMLYYHAERRNYAVIGTANKNEHDQGFFVKYGDGGADVQPIVHLFKTQIYELAEYLEIPTEIRNRPPTTDTYSAHSTQQEFFFRLPFHVMDLIWYAHEHHLPLTEVAQAMDLTESQVQNVIRDIMRKQRTTEYLRMPPLRLDSPQALQG